MGKRGTHSSAHTPTSTGLSSGQGFKGKEAVYTQQGAYHKAVPGTLPKPALVVGEATTGTSKIDAPISFKDIGNPKKVNPFDKVEEMVSQKRRRLYEQTPGAT